jgi:hypothetical protein
MTKTTTKIVTRFWVVSAEHTLISSHKTEKDARAKAASLIDAGIDVLRIERQTVTTTTSHVCEF